MVDFDEKLTKAETSDEIKKLKVWMFQEQVRIQAQKDELNELSRKLQRESESIERERNALNTRVEAEHKRFRNNEIFMAKKQKIIEDAFRQLALDKKTLECERLNFEYEKGKYKRQRMSNSRKMYMDTSSLEGIVFFRGIDNELALKKRYKELLKIFHPDNRCGDTKTLLRIQTEYESMKKKYYEI